MLSSVWIFTTKLISDVEKSLNHMLTSCFVLFNAAITIELKLQAWCHFCNKLPLNLG